LMLDFFDDPEFVHSLFEFIIEMELRFAQAQVDAGADIIGIGDAASSLVGPAIYDEHVAGFEQKLIDGIRAMGCLTRLHICGNTTKLLAKMGHFGADIVDLDYMAPIADARRKSAPGQVLLGNIDPVKDLRNGDPKSIQEKLAACHRDAGPRYIAGAGCEVVRDTPEDNVRALVDYAKCHQPTL